MKPSVSVQEEFGATDPPSDIKSWIKQFAVRVQQSDELFCDKWGATEYTAIYLDSAPDSLEYIGYPITLKNSSHVIELEINFYQSRDDSDDLIFNIRCYKNLDNVDGLFGYGPIIDEVEKCYNLSSEIFLDIVDEMYSSKQQD